MPAFLLSEYEFVRVSGADTIKFLQGQVSCNMELLSPQQSLSGALCNLKGRVIADFRALQVDSDCLLQTGPGMAEVVLATLGKYAVFSRVELSKDDRLPPVLGILGDEAGAALAGHVGELPLNPGQVSRREGLAVVRIPGRQARFELWGMDEAAAGDLQSDPRLAMAADLTAWLAADIEAGIIHVGPDTSAEYTPQLLNYDISGVIDFKKGCYTGQEVVARMYYRGKPKKRLFLLQADGPIGTDSRVLEAGSDQPGEILSCSDPGAGADGRHLALAILSADVAERRPALSLSDRPEVSLQVLALPYTE